MKSTYTKARYNNSLVYINTNYSELQKAFKLFENENFDDSKSQCKFTIPTEHGEVEIYDWKQYACDCECEFDELEDIESFNINLNSIKEEKRDEVLDFIINELNK